MSKNIRDLILLFLSNGRTTSKLLKKSNFCFHLLCKLRCARSIIVFVWSEFNYAPIVPLCLAGDNEISENLFTLP